jgi:Fic family protein
MTTRQPRLKPLAGLDPDIQRSLLAQVRDLWTHGSAALEGNTLTLGETKFVIEEGLMVSGKPLKDHEEVVGHALMAAATAQQDSRRK